MNILNLNTIQKVSCNESFAAFKDQLHPILNCRHPFRRSNQIGHITASGLVIRGDKVLLIFHPYIKCWFQPGGHIDEGELPVEAAIREVYEETGFVCGLDPEFPEPIDIDVHEIPANPIKGEGPHLHVDLLYKLNTLKHEKSLEDISCGWFSFNQVESTRIKRALTRLSS